MSAVFHARRKRRRQATAGWKRSAGGAENIPDAARQEAAARGLDIRGVDAVIIGNTCYVNAAKLRPSDVPKRVLEEVAGHRGIRAVFGDQYDSMLDGVYRDFFDTEEFREVVQRYFRGRKLESVDDQRYATEEFLAHNARMRPELKPAWWQSFLERIKMALRKLPGFHNLRFTDRELERILIRGIGAVRKEKSEEGGARFSIIGEEGAGRGREAEARMSDLRIAREMETAGKDAKTIKRATGWERGGDGKWRMEIPDLKIKREETLSLIHI